MGKIKRGNTENSMIGAGTVYSNSAFSTSNRGEVIVKVPSKDCLELLIDPL